jgi:hypothetical protein
MQPSSARVGATTREDGLQLLSGLGTDLPPIEAEAVDELPTGTARVSFPGGRTTLPRAARWIRSGEIVPREFDRVCRATAAAADVVQ